MKVTKEIYRHKIVLLVTQCHVENIKQQHKKQHI